LVKSPPADLKNARILVTNDDGIHAPGLKVLEKIARSLSSDVWVVTPESEHSGASHALTLRRPLPLHDRSRHRPRPGYRLRRLSAPLPWRDPTWRAP